MRLSSLAKLAPLFLGAFILFAAGRAEAHQVRYEGMHPVPAEYGGGFCEIDFPHVHVFEPQRADVLYRNHDGGYAFVGDPVPYGYAGPKHAFYGPHPMQDGNGDLEYCYIDGPHYHELPPPVTVAAQFKLKGGVYFYAGHFPQMYYDMRPRYSRINVIYKPLEYSRPVVVAAPPEATVVVDSGPRPMVVAGGGVGVEAGIGIHAGIGAGFIVGSPPPTTVVVGAPPPVVVVHERQPRTVIIEERRPVEVIRVKEHHDNGRHEGHGHAWGKGW